MLTILSWWNIRNYTYLIAVVLFNIQGMKDRKNLTMSPEVGLKNAISHGDNIDKYGHLLNEALQQVRVTFSALECAYSFY